MMELLFSLFVQYFKNYLEWASITFIGIKDIMVILLKCTLKSEEEIGAMINIF